jgi:hypothetical protein
MRKAFGILVLTAGLASAGTASAGCFATAGLGPPPDGLRPGATWLAKLTVLQHGITPMPDARPTVVVEDGATGKRRSFAAKPVDRAGNYVARVVFPTKGSWRLAVVDGFAVDGRPVPECEQTHTFGAVAIGGEPTGATPGAPPPAADARPATAGGANERPVAAVADGSFPVWPVVGGVLFALAVALASVRLRRNGVKAPARTS